MSNAAATLIESDQKRAAVGVGLRSASAGVICLLVTEWLHLENGYLSVFTAHLANLQYANTPFQKEVERIVGRLAGIFYCTVVVIYFRDSAVLCLTLLAAALLPVWYVQSSGMFAYGTFLAGIFMVQTAASSLIGPPYAAIRTFYSMAFQLLLGAVVIELINFGSGAEKSLAIKPGGQPLLPLRPEWISRSFMIVTTTFAALFLGWLASWPIGPTIVSTIILAATPSPEALEQKGIQRAAAVVVITLYSVTVLMVLTRIPGLGLLMLFLFLALFLGAYVAQTSVRYSYVGLQVGIVAPMVLIVSPAEVADLRKAIQRLLGIIGGFAVAIVFQELWPFNWQSPPAPSPLAIGPGGLPSKGSQTTPSPVASTGRQG